MFTSSITKSLFDNFRTDYKSTRTNKNSIAPYVYADEHGVKLLTGLVGHVDDHDDIFAIGIAGDGFMELFSIN